MDIAVAGEVLFDLSLEASDDDALHFAAREAGSPLNTALAAVRLGRPAGLLTQLSTDFFGQRLWRFMGAHGLDRRFVTRGSAPSSLAFVAHEGGSNQYAFYTEGTADSGWSPEPLPELPADCRVLHFGSLALLRQPAATRILDLVRASRNDRWISFDPNVRPSLVHEADRYRGDVADWMHLADMVKLSEEDAAYLAPGCTLDDAVARWLTLGPQALVVTRGAQGATLHRPGRPTLHLPAPQVSVVDTVGAGDTFSAGLMVGLLDAGVRSRGDLDRLPDASWTEAMSLAGVAAALNCTRPGAQPPLRDVVDAYRATQPLNR